MNSDPMTVRTKVTVELGIIAVLTIAFLLLFPHRNPWFDVGLAGFALLCIGASAGYTKNVVWAASPPQPGRNRFSQCVKITLWVTVPTVVGFLLAGAILGYRNSGWPGVTERILNWKILAVFGAYLAWALMRQTLFQFYLLGRLLALFPKDQRIWPVLITGLGFSLVHLPDVWTSLVTAVAGVVDQCPRDIRSEHCQYLPIEDPFSHRRPPTVPVPQNCANEQKSHDCWHRHPQGYFYALAESVASWLRRRCCPNDVLCVARRRSDAQ